MAKKQPIKSRRPAKAKKMAPTKQKAENIGSQIAKIGANVETLVERKAVRLADTQGEILEKLPQMIEGLSSQLGQIGKEVAENKVLLRRGFKEAAAAKSTASTLTSDDRAVLRALVEEQWTAAGLARDWDKALGMCAQDIVYMPSDHTTLRGHAAFREWLEQFPPIVKFTQRMEQVDGNANLAVTPVTFAATVEVGGQQVENTGKALVTYQKDSSGKWLVKSVCFNWDRPMPSAS